VFKDNIEAALNLNEPSIISSYILELASLFNKYYQNYRLIGRDCEYIKPRLYLLTAIKIVLINALKLLCMPILERM
ncbi:MAG: DALR anticodon-binding domain-containing protein, partial [Deltaproteobacteria bacterium]|nr:DALR anticodon-binding domain-containing protein [Deltaproteobacteria bacterium]